MRKWLKDLRSDAGITQAELAVQADISEQFIYYIESGERRPSPEVAKRLAKALGFDWTRFYEEDAEKTINCGEQAS